VESLKKKLQKEERRKRGRKNRRRLLVLFLLILLGAGIAAGYYLSRDPLRVQEQHYQHALQLLDRQDYSAAVQQLDSFYKTYPNAPQAAEAIFQAAEALELYLKEYHPALLDYLLLEKDYPASPRVAESRLRVAEIYKYRLRDYNRAIASYQNILDSGTAVPDRIQYEVADAYFRLNNFEQARIEFESLLSSYPESPLLGEASFRIGVAQSLDGHPRDAEKTFRAFIKDHPDDPFAREARFSLATLLEERGELKESLQILETLRDNYPQAEVLEKKIDQVKERISKKKKAI